MNLNVGIIGNAELVNLFGTDKNKETFKIKNKVDASLKKSLLKRAYCVCDIEDLGNGKYKIKKIRDYILPQSLYNINKGLYKWLTPMILKKILYDYSYQNAYQSGKFGLATYIGMINENYTKIKKYKSSASEELNLDYKNLIDFYSHIDNYIEHYIETCLKNLKSCGAIDYDNPYMISYREFEDAHETSNINLKFNEIKFKLMGDSENRIYIDIENEIMKEMNISNLGEAYHSKNTFKFVEELNLRLSKTPVMSEDGKKIRMLRKFKVYRIWYNTIEACENLLNEFPKYSLETIIEEFNNEFIDLALSNLKIRLLGVEKTKEIKKFIKDYKLLSKLTLNYNEENVELDETPKVHINKEKGNYSINISLNDYL